MRLHRKIIIWDLPEEIAIDKDESIIIYWSRKAKIQNKNTVNIADYLEANSDIIKSDYLRWIDDLLSIKLNDTSLEDLLRNEEGFSYWWMSLTLEKCNFHKSKYIDECIKIIALRYILMEYKFSSIELYSKSSLLNRVIKKYCAGKEIKYLSNVEKKNKEYNIHNKILKAIKYTLKYYIRHVNINDKPDIDKGNILFVNYLLNIDNSAFDSKIFKSNYWGTLSKSLIDDNINTNWLHIFSPNPQFQTSKEAGVFLNRINKNNTHQTHISSSAFISTKLLVKAFFEWIKIRRKTSNLHNVKLPLCKGMDIGLYHKNDLLDSIMGTNLLSNIIWYRLLDRLLEYLPKHRLGIYLQENMDWEKPLVFNWRKHGHSTIIGFPHSTIRYWDLRYFGYTSQAKVIPNYIISSGLMAKKHLEHSGLDSSKLLDAEALRYEHLKINHKKLKSSSIIDTRILVLTEYNVINSNFMLNILNKTIGSYAYKTTVDLKAHPATPIDLKDYEHFKYSNTLNDSIETILTNHYSAVITTSASSVSLEAFLRNKKVIVVHNPRYLNLSPLRDINHSKAYVVSNEDELYWALNDSTDMVGSDPRVEDYMDVASYPEKWIDIIKSFTTNEN